MIRLGPFVTLVLCVLAAGIPPARAQHQAEISTALNFSALQPGQQAVLAVTLDIPEGLHSQSNTPLDANLIATEVTIEPNAVVESYAPVYPPGQIEQYPALGRVSVYTGRAIIYVPLQVRKEAPAGPMKIRGQVNYQLCDDRLCFNPESETFELATQIVPAGQAVQANQPDLFAEFDPSIFSRLVKPTPARQRVAIFGKSLDEAPLVFPFFVAFLVGVIFNVVPCVLPVVPLKAMSFYEVSQHNRAKCLALGALFSLGIIATFAAMAVLVVAMRAFEWGQLFSYTWFLLLIVGLLVVFALQMFGAFEVILPTAIYRVTPSHESYLGNFLFGIFTAILSTPCTFGMFLGLLIWASAQPSWLGVSLLMVVGLGMAFPYLILSAFPELARRFPRSGPWPLLVKQMMGFLLLASAVYFARRFLQEWFGDKVFWWMLFGVVAAAGVFLVLRATQFARTYVGPIVATVIALLFVAPSLAMTLRITNPPIDWKPYTEAALAEARKSNRPVLVEFTAAWCGNCLALEATVFHDEQTVQALRDMKVVTLRADVTKPDAPGWKLLREISPIGAIPLTAIYHPGAPEPVQLSGIYSVDDLVNALKTAR